MGLIDSSITYSGKNAEGFYTTALLTGDTKSRIRAVPNVKDKINMASLDLGNILQADSCDVAESGNYTLDQKVLQVCDFAFNIPLCEKDYEPLYLSEQLRPGSNVEQNYPNGFVDFLFELVANKISEQTEDLIWSGSTTASPPDLCDGFIKKFLDDSAVVDVASPTTLTSSNIIAEMTKVVNAIPTTVKNKGKNVVKIFVSINAAHLYELALVTASPALYAYNNADLNLTFMGYELIVSPGMPANTIVACDPMNLWYGFDLLADEKEISFMKNPNPGKTKQSNIIGSFKWGVEYGVGSEVVLYGTGS